ncbi:LytS/YhcK type 5TM receptor domain-containing protein [Brevibacillus fluminis]|uniref:LytS/YhcK type 5TM receptor domain-containing protein n=1 Tax=Brevibacillus fluminis TaxID=511487 RepID=UPI003F89DF4B
METLTLVLLERMGLLLAVTFTLIQIRQIRQLLDRQFSMLTSLTFSFMFGLFGIAGTYAGVVVTKDTFSPSFWMVRLMEQEAIANSSLVGVVIGGLLGGPLVGLGAGIVTGIHLYSLGGFAALPMGLSAPLTGLLTGWVARFFSDERVISPAKALFIGMFAPILQMGLILIFASPSDTAIRLVNTIGIPMVITNSVFIAIFTTMIRLALKEEERSAAFEAERALKIAELILPHLKRGLTKQTAEQTAQILKREMQVTAVTITDTQYILAHSGVGSGHHEPGERVQTQLSLLALATGKVQVAHSREQIQCPHADCPLRAGIIIPFCEAGRVVGLIKLYYQRSQQIRKIEEVVAQGLGNLISNQLNLSFAEKMTSLMKDAELRLLQAQINPHFLFNTLNSIVTLIRIDPSLARHMTIQLSVFMRLNLKMTTMQLVPIHQELDHLQAFLEIVKIRFADQFSVVYETQEGIGEAMIPPLTLQPLIENSIQHGLKAKPSGGLILISLRRVGEEVHIAIEDNGEGLSEQQIEQLGAVNLPSAEGNGIGVYNVNQRLVSLFGTGSRLHYANREEGGTRVFFSVPIHHHKGDE